MNSNDKEIEYYQQVICNLISYVLYLYEKHIITERTRDEILKICNPSMDLKSWKKKQH